MFENFRGEQVLITGAPGWKPKVPLKSGRRKLLDYHLSHHTHYWEGAE